MDFLKINKNNIYIFAIKIAERASLRGIMWDSIET